MVSAFPLLGLWRASRILALALFLLGLAARQVAPAQVALPPGFVQTTVTTSLAYPVAMAFEPDTIAADGSLVHGRLFVCEKNGALRVIKNDVLLPDPFVTVNVETSGERGLDGVVVDPNFATNHFIYLYYTATTPTVHNRLSRFTASGDLAVPGSEFVLIDFPTLTTVFHNGGGMHFGPDGKLYVSVGENGVSTNAQSLANPLGKILRINTDGTIPLDNPFYNTATGLGKAIWAMGLRNPFTFNFQPGTGRLFANDVGNDSWEEINDIVSGGNYGWPTYEGYSTDPAYVSPIYAYPHPASGAGAAITGGTFYNPPTNQFPAKYFGKYFFFDYINLKLQTLDPVTHAVSDFASNLAVNPVYLTVSSDGSLYYANVYGLSLFKITYSGTATPQIGSNPADALITQGTPVTFTVTAYGAAPLTYQWERQEPGGTTFNPIPGATSASYTFTTALADSGAQFCCVVSNGSGSATSAAALLSVTTSLPPTVTITSPAPGTTYRAGDVISFAGSAVDPQTGNMPGSALTWKVDFQHRTHAHPFMPETSGINSGTFTIPTVGETDDVVWYRVYLMATDAVGLTTTTYVDVLPIKSTTTLASSPSGLQLTLDGSPVLAPYSFQGVVGMQRTIGVTPQILAGVTYQFGNWTDGGAALHTISTPAQSTTITANMQAATTPVDGATFVSQSVQSVMNGGQAYNVSVTMQNTGTTTWPVTGTFASGGQYRLCSQNPSENKVWGFNRVGITTPVAPGASYTFNFTVLASTTPGTYNFQWQMVNDGVAFFGDITPNIPVVVNPVPADNAQFVSQSVPANMTAGLPYQVTVTLRNIGTDTWQPTGDFTAPVSNEFRLCSANPLENNTWGANRRPVTTTVAPGQLAVFSFTVVAPATPGTYNFQQRMVQDFGVGFFGEFTPNVAVIVLAPALNGAEFVSQSVPSTMAAGQTYSVSVTMRNTGTNTWQPTGAFGGPLANQYRLVSANPLENTTWGGNRVNLTNTVALGQTAVFNFKVVAPATPGTYNFQWQMVQDYVAFFGAQSPNVPVSVTIPPNAAQFVSQSVPSSMAAGVPTNVTITMKNIGTSTWQPTGAWTDPLPNQYRLVSMNPAENTTWGGNRVKLTSAVAPGQNGVFTFSVTPPATPGTYNFQWEMVQDFVSYFGDVSPNVAVNVTTPGNAAAFVSQSVPTTMTAGQSYAISIVMTNTGTNTWQPTGAYGGPLANQYRLVSENPVENNNWGGNRAPLLTAVAPGQNATFNFSVKAPATPGSYNFQWSMVQDYVSIFGALTPNVNVTVVADGAQFVSQAVPASMAAGQTYAVTITMKNTGGTTWLPTGSFSDPTGNQYRLMSENPSENTTWGGNRASLLTTVAPGQNGVFTFNVKAPATPGTYNFQWSMVHDYVSVFGDLTPNLTISVQ